MYNEGTARKTNILGTRNIVLLDPTLGARQARDTSLRLIFPVMFFKYS